MDHTAVIEFLQSKSQVQVNLKPQSMRLLKHCSPFLNLRRHLENCLFWITEVFHIEAPFACIRFSLKTESFLSGWDSVYTYLV